MPYMYMPYMYICKCHKILHNAISFEYIMDMYVLSKTKVKLGGLEVPFKKNSFGKKNDY